MITLIAGHSYQLAERTPDGEGVLTLANPPLNFVNREPGMEAQGTTTQEVIRALIDRTRYCNNCLPHPVNERVVYHLRMALALHEARALEQRVNHGQPIEYAVPGPDGHIAPAWVTPGVLDTPELTPAAPEWEQKPHYASDPGF